MFEIFKSNKKKSVLIILTDEVSPATYTHILAVQGYTDVVRISFDWEVSNWGSREIEDIAVNKAKLGVQYFRFARSETVRRENQIRHCQISGAEKRHVSEGDYFQKVGYLFHGKYSFLKI